ncbi:hypothetical protein CORC01_02329 [Colletotrichum orchidophilum]|uniref:Uncharacterized protein n=1 Tax=Colletotrichum orchidophilum TaxID=1209926 RepID=A0A1G4BM01_9PEZI|nr:uncharacterized protein CORC01_02329 [Colletotrichum orchidophilum]OHF02336.1 hypothetical protein CORC01_02329 [Colletotrichum orchidophilum]
MLIVVCSWCYQGFVSTRWCRTLSKKDGMSHLHARVLCVPQGDRRKLQACGRDSLGRTASGNLDSDLPDAPPRHPHPRACSP